MARIILFGSAVVGVLVVTLAYAIWSGQYEAAQPTPSAVASGSLAPGASPSADGSAVPSASAQAEPSAAASAAASGATTTSTIAALDFGPDLTVAAGSSVTWTNDDTVAHTATEGSNGVAAPNARFDLQLAVEASDSYTFTDPGTYQVTCTLHPTMNMTATVE